MSVDKRMEASTSRRRDGQPDGRTDGRTGRQRDSQADEQLVRVEGIIL